MIVVIRIKYVWWEYNEDRIGQGGAIAHTPCPLVNHDGNSKQSYVVDGNAKSAPFFGPWCLHHGRIPAESDDSKCFIVTRSGGFYWCRSSSQLLAGEFGGMGLLLGCKLFIRVSLGFPSCQFHHLGDLQGRSWDLWGTSFQYIQVNQSWKWYQHYGELWFWGINREVSLF